jgi:aminoglycoside 6'-N-acetyltransferase I
VLYLEGIFVLPQHRGRGISHLLCRAAEDWGARQGIREFASDSDIDNELSIKAHLGLGFEEADRVVCFRKLIEETEAPLTKPQGSENNHEE